MVSVRLADLLGMSTAPQGWAGCWEPLAYLKARDVIDAGASGHSAMRVQRSTPWATLDVLYAVRRLPAQLLTGTESAI